MGVSGPTNPNPLAWLVMDKALLRPGHSRDALCSARARIHNISLFFYFEPQDIAFIGKPGIYCGNREILQCAFRSDWPWTARGNRVYLFFNVEDSDHARSTSAV